MPDADATYAPIEAAAVRAAATIIATKDDRDAWALLCQRHPDLIAKLRAALKQ